MLEVLTTPDFNMCHTGMVIQTSLAQAFNLSTQEEGMGRFLWAWGQPCVLNEVQASGATKSDPVSKRQQKASWTKAETEISDGTGDLDINPEATRCFYKNQKNTHRSKQASQQTLLAELAIYSGRLQLALCLSQHKKTSKQIKDLNAIPETQNLVSTK